MGDTRDRDHWKPDHGPYSMAILFCVLWENLTFWLFQDPSLSRGLPM